jgi:hypothetical protein
MEASIFAAVHPDSIWMWSVSPKANLTIGIAERGGGISVSTEDGLTDLRGGEVLFDGDEDTALDPDQFTQLTRTTPLLIDLGGTFRINRLRFFPRLDRANQRRFLQEFTIRTSPTGTSPDAFSPLLSFYAANANAEPVVDRRFASREVRFLELAPGANREWEIAELEIFSDGTVPTGEFISVPLKTAQSTPIWGKVRFEGGDISLAPVVVQTRTGPNGSPYLYYRLTGKGDEAELVSANIYRDLREEEQGPIKLNPEWSNWETVSEGVVRSPGLRPYLQFRVLLSTPGAVLRRLIFEYAFPPLAQDLGAEIQPLTVAPGQETEFALSLFANLKTTGTADSRDTGFRQLQVLSDAQVAEVTRVLVDDQEGAFTASYQPGQGFTVNLWRRVAQNGSFVQLWFKGRVFHDRTRFEVRALDRRASSGKVETAYQVAREADVDPAPGASLVVQLSRSEKELPLITLLNPQPRVFTPNGDGVNEVLALSYALLKLIEPAPLGIEIYTLNGQRVRQVFAGAEADGYYTHRWDGRDERGALVPPGLYLYEVRVDADQRQERRQGVVGVIY